MKRQTKALNYSTEENSRSVCPKAGKSSLLPSQSSMADDLPQQGDLLSAIAPGAPSSQPVATSDIFPSEFLSSPFRSGSPGQSRFLQDDLDQPPWGAVPRSQSPIPQHEADVFNWLLDDDPSQSFGIGKTP